MVINKTVTVRSRRIANALISKGFNVVEIAANASNPMISYFIFDNSDEIEAALNDIEHSIAEYKKAKDKRTSTRGGYKKDTVVVLDNVEDR